MLDSQRPIFALLLRLCAALFVSSQFMLVKLAAETGLALPEIMFWRQAIPAAALLTWFAQNRKLAQLKTHRLGAHAGRAMTGTIGMLCNFSAATLLSLPEATTLSFTTPLFAVVLAALVLHHRVGPWRWGAVLLGFLGVVLIAQPWGEPIAPLGAAAGLGAGLMVAISSFQIKDLARTEQGESVVLYFALFGALMTAPFLPFVMHGHTPEQWLLLFAVGQVGMFAQLLLTASLRHGVVASVVVMDYSALFWAVLYGWLIWNHFPPVMTLLGAPVIVAAGAIIAWRESRLTRNTSPVTALEGD